jgi:Peptidase family M23
VLAVTVPASVVRVPGLPAGDDPLGVAAWALVVVVLAGTLWRARRHRWGDAVRRPLTFPLRGTWYVAHGGGQALNHHARLREQRGAVDLVQVGPWGTLRAAGARRDDPRSYLAYGADVYAPCDGRVVSAVDDLEDQVPGVTRYAPPFGNHVVLDTGAELVRLGHLRPGSVTVRAGDTVRAGRLLGQVGNSGNTSEPHLHLQADRDGAGLDLVFHDVPGLLVRGRTVTAAAPEQAHSDR